MKKRKSPLVLLSILGVITTLSFVIGNTMSTRQEKKLAQITNQAMIAPSATPKQAMPTPSKVPKPTPSPVPTVSFSPIPVATPSPEPSPTPVTLVLPATGAEIIGEYTEDMLVFHETYGDYRAHTGLDFAGNKNAPVCAVADGIIVKNYFDYEDGYTVEIEHNDGINSIYKNLSSDKMAQVGQVVRQGDVIGAMGDTGISESHLSYHLHFELTKDGETVNPRELFQASFASESTE